MAARVKERPRTAPRDVFIGDRQVLLRWRKTRWYCGSPGCDQGTFTEALPAVPARARLTGRLRTRLGACIGDDLMPAAAAARRYEQWTCLDWISDFTACAQGDGTQKWSKVSATGGTYKFEFQQASLFA